MKVYTVEMIISNDFDNAELQRDIQGVFASRELATEEVDRIHDDYRNSQLNDTALIGLSISCDIKEFELMELQK